MITTKRTDVTDTDFQNLVAKLDAGLKVVDGDLHDFYHQYNGISDIKYALVAYLNGQAVGCGAIKQFGDDVMEVKRMYVNPIVRNQGVATTVLLALETWAKELGCERCVLETGKMQKAALKLYPKNGYVITENYGQYIGVENSVCFEKIL